MKTIIIIIAFSLFSFGTINAESSNVTNEVISNEVISNEGYYEYTIVDDTCYARWCWNPSETSRRCSEWQEVPCDTVITGEIVEISN
jgi:hypothetical protein